ncbi:UNVERIFIED_ORG: protein-tyrosine phosphatase [Nocardia globerula]|uniref:Protein-tyrosine phosphatase n=1 Tax=Nocardia globerula TaxID=1818 RepID=A0A652YQL3_NOCGL|nr:tyrosine-protein phosphatase [Rhodococcus globerulus]NMD63585.1 tyrosine-protein phosphatase [Nocardia globerula]PVX63150.1 protein-tyrosine phosphatase [Rhodococcus globerulus]
MPTHPLDRRVLLKTAPNFRDLGGIAVAGGTVRPGALYRSATLAKLDGDDVAAVARLDIRTVYDLRTAAERDGALDNLPDSTRTVWLDVLADNAQNAAATGLLMTDPAAYAETISGGRGISQMEEANRNFVSLPSAAYRTFYLDLIDEKRTGAALFHCTTGKDRTGWAATSFLLLLGADEADVRADYLQTNTDLAPMTAPILDFAASKGVDAELLRPLLGVRDSYFDAALDEMRTLFGTVEDYAINGLKLTAEQLTALRERFTSRSGFISAT